MDSISKTIMLSAKKTLGNTGVEVSQIIYGTSYLGNLYAALPYQEKLALMKKWFECTEKPVVIDSAGKYGAGLALETIGRGLTDLGIDPDDIMISNKLGWYRVPLETEEPTFEPGAWVDLEYDAIQIFGYDEIIKCFEQGNELLGGRYRSDIASVHDPDEYLHAASDSSNRAQRFQEILESYRALFDLKKQGKVKAVGIGSKDWTIIRELYEHVRFDWVMLANSYTIFSHPKELVQFMDKLKEDNVGIINSAVFHGGFLSGGEKFDYQDIAPDSKKGRIIYPWRKEFNSICEQHGLNPADVCLHFGLSHPAIVGLALNTSKPEKMNKNVEILNDSIPASFWNALKKNKLINTENAYLNT